jgi:hypothetical protein
MNKKQLAIAAGVAFGLLGMTVLMGSGAIQSAYSLIENSGTPLTRRSTLNFVDGGCADNATNSRTDCTISGGSGSAGGVTTYNGSAPANAGTTYISIGGSTNNFSSNEIVVRTPISSTGTASGFYASVAIAPGTGNSYAFTFRDNGSNTSITCTISGASATTCNDTTDTASVNAGDLVDYSIVTTGTSVAGGYLGVSLLLPSSATANPQFTISNASATGTTVNTLTTLTGAPSTAVIVTAGATGGVVGVTTAGAGTSGTATITTAGTVSCVFDGSTMANDYVQVSSGTNGDCTDAGSTYPSTGQVLGRVLSTNGSGGTYTLDLFPSEIKGGSGGGSSGYTPFSNLTALSSSGWSWLNQGSSTVTYTGGVLAITATGTGGDELRVQQQSLPGSAPWTVIGAMMPQTGLYGTGTGSGYLTGICLTDGTKLKVFGIGRPAAGAPLNPSVELDNYNSFTSFNGNLKTAPPVYLSPVLWLKIHNDGTNFTYWYSEDPTNVGWSEFYSEATNSFLTPTNGCYTIDMYGAGLNGVTIITDGLISWVIANS